MNGKWSQSIENIVLFILFMSARNDCYTNIIEQNKNVMVDQQRVRDY